MRSSASSESEGFKHEFAWDEKIHTGYIFTDYIFEFEPVCDFRKRMHSDFFESDDFDGEFGSFFDYFCEEEDQDSNTEEYHFSYYDYLTGICDFDSALKSGFFTSSKFSGDFPSFSDKYCDYEYDFDNYYDYDSYYYYYDLDYGQELFVSQSENQPWLQLEFEKDVEVSQIWFTSIYDDFDEQLWFTDITISVGMESMETKAGAGAGTVSRNPLCATFDGPSAAGANLTLPCNEPLTGIYVIIQQDNSDAAPKKLAINEVYICGKFLDETPLWWK